MNYGRPYFKLQGRKTRNYGKKNKNKGQHAWGGPVKIIRIDDESIERFNSQGKCPICLKSYDQNHRPVTYHVSYNPEKTIKTCNICNYYEYLSRTKPESLPKHASKFIERFLKIKDLSPQYQYRYPKKYKVKKVFYENGQPVKTEKSTQYRVEPV